MDEMGQAQTTCSVGLDVVADEVAVAKSDSAVVADMLPWYG